MSFGSRGPTASRAERRSGCHTAARTDGSVRFRPSRSGSLPPSPGPRSARPHGQAPYRWRADGTAAVAGMCRRRAPRHPAQAARGRCAVAPSRRSTEGSRQGRPRARTVDCAGFRAGWAAPAHHRRLKAQWRDTLTSTPLVLAVARSRPHREPAKATPARRIIPLAVRVRDLLPAEGRSRATISVDQPCRP